MRTNIKSKKLARYKNVILVILAVALLGGIIFVALEKLQITNFTNQPKATEPTNNQTIIDNNPPTAEQKQAGEDIKTANQTPVSTTVSTTITAKNTTADTLQIRSMTNGAVSNSGTCNLTLTKNSVTISKSASTDALPSSSTCQGFDINRSELSNGTWQINLEVIINGEMSNATSEVTLE